MAKIMTVDDDEIDKKVQRYFNKKIDKRSKPMKGRFVVGKCTSKANATGKHVHIKTICNIKRKTKK